MVIGGGSKVSKVGSLPHACMRSRKEETGDGVVCIHPVGMEDWLFY